MAPGLVLHAGCLLPCKNSRLWHIAAQNVFWLSSKVVALHLDSSTAKAYLCNQSDIASLFCLD